MQINEVFERGKLASREVVDLGKRLVTTYEADAKATLKLTAERAMSDEEVATLTAAENERTIDDRVRKALEVNKTFLALASPTNAQTLAQVKALTRQVSGIIRILVREFGEVE